MGNLLNPYRIPSPYDSRFVAPLHPMWNDDYYPKLVQDMGAGTMTDSRTVSGTFAMKYSAPPTTHFPRLFEFSILQWDDASIRWGFAHTSGNMFLSLTRNDKTEIFNGNFGGYINGAVSNWCDGTIRRCALIIDLDNLTDATTGMWVNGTQVLTGWNNGDDPGTSPTNDIPWSTVDRWGILVDCAGGTQFENMVDGDGVGMYSLSTKRDLNIDKVFDANGYFTNPGKHFREWYTTRPEFAYINAPYVNQGWVHWVNGRNFNHDPCETWDYTSTSENHHMKTVTTPGGNGEINSGVAY